MADKSRNQIMSLLYHNMNLNSKMLAVIIMAPARIGLSSQTFLRESVSITILFKCAHDGKQMSTVSTVNQNEFQFNKKEIGDSNLCNYSTGTQNDLKCNAKGIDKIDELNESSKTKRTGLSQRITEAFPLPNRIMKRRHALVKKVPFLFIGSIVLLFYLISLLFSCQTLYRRLSHYESRAPFRGVALSLNFFLFGCPHVFTSFIIFSLRVLLLGAVTPSGVFMAGPHSEGPSGSGEGSGEGVASNSLVIHQPQPLQVEPPVVQQPQPFQPEPAGFDLNLPQGGAEPAVGIERDFFDLNLPAQPEPGEIEDIGSRFSKKELISMGLPANLQNLSLEQQQDLWLRAWEHFRLKVQIIELFKARFPKENWIQSESVRKTIFISHFRDNEFYLEELQAMRNNLVFCDKPWRISPLKKVRERFLNEWKLNHPE